MKTLNFKKSIIKSTLESLQGRFISVEFAKLDGTLTKRNGKLVKSPQSHEGKELFSLIQYTKEGKKYCSIYPERVLNVFANKSKISFI